MAATPSPAPPSSALIELQAIYRARTRLREVAEHTPLFHNPALSDRFGCSIYLKREDLQVVRSYKIRGAFNKMATLSREQLDRGVVCASAGNHAQGVAFACRKLRANGRIYMPAVTPAQKVEKVRSFGREFVQVVLIGDTFDDAYAEAKRAEEEEGMVFVHPFDDPLIIAGQATVGIEILEDCPEEIDIVLVAVGGGGLLAGLGSYFRHVSPNTKIIGVEPAGAPAMHESLRRGEIVRLDRIDSFVDGAAVKQVGERNFAIARDVLSDLVLVEEGKVCSTILQLYNEEGMVVEPAGALTVAALDQLGETIRGKTVVCVVSGGNNDISRTEEIRERALLYEGRKHYFIIQFPQRAGALRDFLNEVLGPDDDITHFEYTKKHSRGMGPAMVGLQLARADDYAALVERMEERGIVYQHLNDNSMLFELLV